MRSKLTIYSLLLFLLMTGNVSAQSPACCDSVMALPDTMARYGDGNQSLMKFSEKELYPMFEDIRTETGVMITSLRTKLTIDCKGKVTEAIIMNKDLSQNCKEKLAGKFLTMSAWKPAYKDGKAVCCTFYFPISCIKWE